MTARTFTLVMPIARLINSNQREHWAPRAAKTREMRETARIKARGLAPIDGPAELTVTFAFPDRRRRDLDNYSIKAAIDGAVDAHVIADDRSTVLRNVTRIPAQECSPKGCVVMVFEFTPSVGGTVANGTIGRSEKDGPRLVTGGLTAKTVGGLDG